MVKNILIVINSDEPVSQEVADYYASVRNLTFRYLSISFGPQTGVLTVHTDLETIIEAAEAIRSFAIDAVICSAKVPIYFDHVLTGLVSFEAALGCSQYIVEQTWNEQMDNQQIVDIVAFISRSTFRLNYDFMRWISSPPNPIPKADSTGEYGDIISDNINSYDWNGNEKVVAYGRIGLPRLEPYYPEETFQSCVYIIDNAVSGNDADYSNKKVHYSYINAPGKRFDWPYLKLAKVTMESLGIYSESLAALGIPLAVIGDVFTYVLLNLGTYKITPSGFPPSIWGFVGQAKGIEPENLDTLQMAWLGDPSPYIPQGGAWAALSGSKSLSGFGTRLLANNFCAVLGDVDADSDFDTNSFCRLLSTGASMAESNLYSNLSVLTTRSVWGDPLYVPYNKNSVVVG